MFSGIIQEIGRVIRVVPGTGKTFTVSCNKIPVGLKIGDSIAVNGACQTAIDFNSNSFTFYSSQETLSLTNLTNLNIGSYVNLERPLSLNTLLDGHIVQGHVDETGVIEEIRNNQGEYHIRIRCSNYILRYIIQKGSVAVDGVSLTINDVYDNGFRLTLIPLTYQETIFQYKKIGDSVNLEGDIFAKYVEKFVMGKKVKPGLTSDFLSEHGFN